ncbi:hypothetical protein SDC9_134623 [bioreactor metagenome]|uniref:Uncharacterized protein n=1 Tax=bioreactor metagenome TaxID=1076179 RepID=A0A645DDT5_9ZZZZ
MESSAKGTERMITNDLQNRIHFGDREAFLAIYHEYGPGIYAAAKKALISDSLAKNAVKQAFLTLYEEILTQTEDFDIPVRLRELTEREIHLLRLVSGDINRQQDLSTLAEQPVLEAELTSARGAFAEQAELLINLPALERERSFRRPKKALFHKTKKRKSADAQTALVWKIILVIIDLFLLWVLAGLLMGIGYLPPVDLGYSWFSRVLSAVTIRLS